MHLIFAKKSIKFMDSELKYYELLFDVNLLKKSIESIEESDYYLANIISQFSLRVDANLKIAIKNLQEQKIFVDESVAMSIYKEKVSNLVNQINANIKKYYGALFIQKKTYSLVMKIDNLITPQDKFLSLEQDKKEYGQKLVSDYEKHIIPSLFEYHNLFINSKTLTNDISEYFDNYAYIPKYHYINKCFEEKFVLVQNSYNEDFLKIERLFLDNVTIRDKIYQDIYDVIPGLIQCISSNEIKVSDDFYSKRINLMFSITYNHLNELHGHNSFLQNKIDNLDSENNDLYEKLINKTPSNMSENSVICGNAEVNYDVYSLDYNKSFKLQEEKIQLLESQILHYKKLSELSESEKNNYIKSKESEYLEKLNSKDDEINNLKSQYSQAMKTIDSSQIISQPKQNQSFFVVSDDYQSGLSGGFIHDKLIREKFGISGYQEQVIEENNIEQQVFICTIPCMQNSKNRTIVNNGDVINKGTVIGKYFGEVLIIEEGDPNFSPETQVYQFQLEEIIYKNKTYQILLEAKDLPSYLAYVNDPAAGKGWSGQGVANIEAKYEKIDYKKYNIPIKFSDSVNLDENQRKEICEKLSGYIISAIAIRNIIFGEALLWSYGDNYKLSHKTFYLNSYWSHKTPYCVWNEYSKFYKDEPAYLILPDTKDLKLVMKPDLQKILDFIYQDNRPLSKLAAESEVQGDSERRTAVYALVHEDSSTESTQQLASAVEFRKRSNNNTTEQLSRILSLPILFLDKDNQKLQFVENYPYINLFMLACLQGDMDAIIRIFYAMDNNDEYLINPNYQMTYNGYSALHCLIKSPIEDCNESQKISIFQQIINRNTILLANKTTSKQMLCRLDLLDSEDNNVLFCAIASNQIKLAMKILLIGQNSKFIKDEKNIRNYVHPKTNYNYIEYAISLDNIEFLKLVKEQYPEDLIKILNKYENNAKLTTENSIFIEKYNIIKEIVGVANLSEYDKRAHNLRKRKASDINPICSTKETYPLTKQSFFNDNKEQSAFSEDSSLQNKYKRKN